MTKTTEQKTLKFIDENHLIEKGDKVLVAFSGGADSVFLLAFLVKFKKRFNIDVAAFHLNHNLRGKSAGDDVRFCNDFCSKNRVKFIAVSTDVKAYAKKLKVSVEEAGRENRYSELDKAVKKIGFTKIATAHNASDNVETILLNFIKGTGLKGLSGIPIRRNNIIRPILCLTSDEIRKYLKSNKISFRIDKSNLNSDYERNFLRNKIIPKLKQRLNPRLEEKVNNTSKIISKINSFIENQIEKITSTAVKFDGKELRINLETITNLDKSLLGILLKTVVENSYNIELSSENIYALAGMMKTQSGSTVQLKGNLIASRERKEIIIWSKHSTSDQTRVYKLSTGQKIKVDANFYSISKVSRKMIKFSQDKSVEFISGDGLSNEFEISKWKAGDKFQPIGMKGRKKISDFLSDEKISSLGKKQQLVLTNSGRIVWVIGLRIDEQFKITSLTKKILKLTIADK